MKKLTFSLCLFALVLALSCDEEEGDCAPADRTGAHCKDGTHTTDTGSGACSNHGGVDQWLCD